MTLFKNRHDAGKRLAQSLSTFKNAKDTIIIAIPRGGLQIGAELSSELKLPLDVFFTKKIGHPLNPEFAIGVVSQHDEIINKKLISDEHISSAYLQSEIRHIKKVLHEKEKLYRKNRKALDLRNKTVIVTDDGVATGKTLLLTLELIKNYHPKKIILAIPVGPLSALNLLKPYVHEAIFLYTPSNFFAISEFYQNFDQVDDQEAMRLLKESYGYTH